MQRNTGVLRYGARSANMRYSGAAAVEGWAGSSMQMVNERTRSERRGRQSASNIYLEYTHTGARAHIKHSPGHNFTAPIRV